MINKEKKREILEKLEKEYPDAKTELYYETPFQLLIATILSAQSTDVQVNKITKNLFKKYPDVYALSVLEPSQLEVEIKSIGLFRNKSKNIIATSKMIANEYSGKVPDTLKELIKLPGVGRKTANVVLANVFNKPAIAVDTHVFRVANRIGIANAKTPEATEKDLQTNIPMEKWSDAHHWLILHGRRVCHARKPNCINCTIESLCKYRKKHLIKKESQ